MGKISIVIRCFNEEGHIGRLLDQILKQTVKDRIEIIVVDSGSTDGTLTVVSKFTENVLKIRPEEFSFGKSLNKGCRRATGEFIVLASAHVYPVGEDWIERLIAPFSDSRVALVYGRQQGDERTRFSEKQVMSQWFPDHSHADQDQPFCNNANAVIRRSVWEQQLYDETLTGLEDLDWAKRAMQTGHKIAYSADAPVIHVHEETAAQIYNRYRREAIAMRHIFPQEVFGMIDFLRLFPTNVISDGLTAVREGVFLKNFGDILLFRAMQFWGTYRGSNQRGPVGEKLWKRFYYPGEFQGSTPPATLSGGGNPEEISPGESQTTSQNWIDVSVRLRPGIPVWPGSTGFHLTQTRDIKKGDPSNVSRLDSDVHVGTHVDAPAHFLDGGRTVDQIPLDTLIGPAAVVCLPGVDSVSAGDLKSLKLSPGIRRLLIRTRNSDFWKNNDGTFRENYVALTRDAAQWVVDRGVRLIGIDYLSIQRYQDGSETHRVLMKAETVIIEGLDLSGVQPGIYELICLPLRLEGAEGSPARVVLRQSGKDLNHPEPSGGEK